MARESMADLIALVRTLSNATDWADSDVQLFLDTTRRAYRYLPLSAEVTVAPGGDTFYYAYTAQDTYWENSYTLTDGSYNALTDSGSDPLLGLFSFEDSTPAPVYITGNTYDVYEAAAKLCEAWATALTLDFDFSVDGAAYQRSQKAAGLREAAKTLRAQSKPVVMALTRYDEEG